MAYGAAAAKNFERASGLHCGVAGRYVPNSRNEYTFRPGCVDWLGARDWGCAHRRRVISDCVRVVAARRCHGYAGAHECERAAGNGNWSNTSGWRCFPHCLEGQSKKLPPVNARKNGAGREHTARLDVPGTYFIDGGCGGGHPDWHFDLAAAFSSHCFLKNERLCAALRDNRCKIRRAVRYDGL